LGKNFENTAVELARVAGERALEAFRRTIVLEFKGKKADNPVTALDRETETFLRAELRAAFPEHGLLGEEHDDDIAEGARYVWVIDPIDGTMNFASGLPLFGISVGLLEDGVPVAGCIWVPVGRRFGRGCTTLLLAVARGLMTSRSACRRQSTSGGRSWRCRRLLARISLSPRGARGRARSTGAAGPADDGVVHGGARAHCQRRVAGGGVYQAEHLGRRRGRAHRC